MILVRGKSNMLKLKSYKGLTGHWTKWGGREFDLMDAQNEEKRDTWFCQCCGREFPIELSPYKVRVTDESGYIRICAICYLEDWKNKIIERMIEAFNI
jgi:hypothetical protein